MPGTGLGVGETVVNKMKSLSLWSISVGQIDTHTHINIVPGSHECFEQKDRREIVNSHSGLELGPE